MIFRIYRDEKQEWRWRLIASNGRIVAVSGEGYKTRAGLNKGIAAVKKSGEAELDIEDTAP